jgi:hypothetical protein
MVSVERYASIFEMAVNNAQISMTQTIEISPFASHFLWIEITSQSNVRRFKLPEKSFGCDISMLFRLRRQRSGDSFDAWSSG